MSKFQRNLDEEELKFLGTIYDGIDIQQYKTVEDEIRDIESRYTSRRFLAEGGLKIIESAVDIVTGREVALAVPRDSEDTIIREKFFREARLTASLQHPNIVPVYDLGLDNIDQPYFAMKLIKGETLKELNMKDVLSLPDKLNIFMKVCDAMSYTHSQGLIHLDLKPDNIQISSFGEVSVCDWGLAKVQGGVQESSINSVSLDKFEIDNMTQDGVVKGTPGYMAPEQISGEQKTQQTDIYALGAILFEMLYLKTPVIGKDLMEIIQNTVLGKLQIPDTEVPLPLKAVALKALSRKPEERYGSVEDLQKEIKSYLAGHATQAENAGVGRLFYLLLMRNKAIFTVLLISIIILFVLVLQFISSIKASEKEARDLLFALEQENRKKLELGADAEPRLTAEIINELDSYKLKEAGQSIDKLLKLLPSSKKGQLFKGRLAFLTGDYQNALNFLQHPENEIDKAILRYLKSARLKKNKTQFVDELFSSYEHGAMKYLRSFYQSSESKGVNIYIEGVVAKWRFVQDSWHLLEISKNVEIEARNIILKRVQSLMSKSNWDDTPELAHEAARLVEDGALREDFLKLFTRNLALMKKVEASGSILNPANNALDGRKNKPSNRWEAGPCPVSMTVDLGEARSFNKVLIYFKRSPEIFYKYRVSYSPDGEVFHNIVDASENSLSEDYRPKTHRFEKVSGRFIRLTVLGSSDNERAFVREFEVYEEVRNLAVGQYCTLNEELVENLTNGTSFIGAYTDVKKEEPVIIDLGEECDIGAVKISFKFKDQVDYVFESSADGTTYQKVKALGLDETRWMKNEPVKGRYLRFTFPSENTYVNEIRVSKP